MCGIGANNPYAKQVFGDLTEADQEKQLNCLNEIGKLEAAQKAVGEAGKGNAAAQLSVRMKTMEKRFSEEGKAQAVLKKQAQELEDKIVKEYKEKAALAPEPSPKETFSKPTTGKS